MPGLHGLLGVENLHAVPYREVLAHDLEVDGLQAERFAQPRRVQVVVQAQLLQAQIAGVAFPEGRGFGVVGVVDVTSTTTTFFEKSETAFIVTP